MSIEFFDQLPMGTVAQRVTALRKLGRATWPLGLKTCVSVAKNLVGIRNAAIVTPKQLYDYVAKRGGVI